MPYWSSRKSWDAVMFASIIESAGTVINNILKKQNMCVKKYKVFNFFFFFKVVGKHSFIDRARALNFNFSDSGLFGLHVAGSAHNVIILKI
jgi:hypothetical protein